MVIIYAPWNLSEYDCLDVVDRVLLDLKSSLKFFLFIYHQSMLNDCNFNLGESEDGLDKMAPVARDLDTLAAQADEIDVRKFFVCFIMSQISF